METQLPRPCGPRGPEGVLSLMGPQGAEVISGSSQGETPFNEWILKPQLGFRVILLWHSICDEDPGLKGHLFPHHLRF